MDTVKCEALVCAVDEGTLSAAAEKLGYTPSGVTRMVDALEAELGFPLLTRGRSGVALTADGESMLPLLRAFVTAGHLAREQAANVRGVVEGSIAVGSYYSVAAHWLPDIMREFLQAHPAVTITVTQGGNSTLARLMAESRVDCCFTNRRLAKGDWVPLAVDAMVAWVPTSWPEAKLPAFPVDALEGKPFVFPLPNTRNDVNELFARMNMNPDVRYSVNDNYTAWRMVEAGLGMSMNNLLMSARWKGEVAVLPFEPAQEIELGIAVPSLKTASPALRAFIDLARKRLASPSAEAR